MLCSNSEDYSPSTPISTTQVSVKGRVAKINARAELYSSLTPDTIAPIEFPSMALTPTQIPIQKHYHKKTGLLHGLVKIEKEPQPQESGRFHRFGGNGGSATTTKIIFSIQDPTDSKRCYPSMMATSSTRAASMYQLTSILTGEPLATLQMVPMYRSLLQQHHAPIIAYDVTMVKDKEDDSAPPLRYDSRIYFRVPNPIQSLLLVAGTPRRIDWAVLDTNAGAELPVQDGQKQVQQHVWQTKMKNKLSMSDKQQQQEGVDKKEKEDDATDMSHTTEEPAVHMYRSKAPYVKKGKKKRYALNFHGRGRETSCKNAQIVMAASDGSSHGDDEMVLVQMVKWGPTEYHVDFREPFNAVQAFAFALAQLDL